MSTAQEMADRINRTLPEDWGTPGGDYDTPEEKIDYFNEEGITPAEMLEAGVTQEEIDWMQARGYNVANPPPAIDPSQSTLSPNFERYVNDMLDRAQAAADLEFQPYTGQRFAGASPLQQQAFSGIASLGDPAAYAEALKSLSAASRGLAGLSYAPTQFTTGLTPPRSMPLPQALPQFPENWVSFNPEEKINWLNENKVGIDTLRRFGVPAGDIAWMVSQGYNPNYRPTGGLPEDWEGYLPEEKIAWFNENRVSPQTLRMYGLSDADINWMRQNGYQVPSTAPTTAPAPTVTPAPVTAPSEARYNTFGATPGWDTGAARQASEIGLSLPPGWGNYTAEQKINFFNEQGTTPDQLRQAGIPEADIQWMLNNGFYPSDSTPAPAAPAIDYSQLTPQQIADYYNQYVTSGQYTEPQFVSIAQGLGIPDSSLLSAQQLLFAQNPGWNPPPASTSNQGLSTAAPATQSFADGGLTTLSTPNTASFQLPSVTAYMSPYTSAVTDIAAREARRQADVSRQTEQARLAQAGAYGGSRQAIMEAERQRNLMTQLGDITNTGLQSAYDRALAQRQAEATLGLDAQKLSEQSRQFGATFGLQGLQAQTQAGQALAGLGTQQGTYGLNALNTMLGAGATQQGIAQQPLDFSYQQWQESMKYPYQQATFMSSMLGGLPLAAAPYSDGSSSFATGLQGLLAGLALTGGLK